MYVAEIWIYPIKSLKGISLTKSQASLDGLKYDRQWMLVDEDGKFVSQRTFPKMSQIKVQIEDGGYIECHADQFGSIRFHESEYLPEVYSGSIWKSDVKIQEVNLDVSNWFSKVLEQNVRLVKMGENTKRKRYSHKLNENFTTIFADGYPFLFLSKASVDFLNNKLTEPVLADRFRANIILDDCEAHAEDNLSDFKIGTVSFRNAKPCVRCTLINTDQETAERGKEPLATLSTYRNQQKNKVIFGMNVLAQTEGEIKVGYKVMM